MPPPDLASSIALPAGVHVFERGWLSSNNVLLVGDDRTVLVDTGYHTHSAQTLALVHGVLGNRPLDVVANTHLHSDHCGGNAAIQRRYPALRTLIPPGLAASVAAWDPVALTYAATGQFCPEFRFDDLLTPGSIVSTGTSRWEIHAAPGHDPHSIILFDASRGVLISADALWERGFGVVFPELEGESAFDDVAATFDTIQRLAPRIVIPGHGRPFTDVAGALEHARSRLAAYRADPKRHAAHAAKVLLKFKLLEWQRQLLPALVDWARETPYFGLVRSRWYPETDIDSWIRDLVTELVRSSAARWDADHLTNR